MDWADRCPNTPARRSASTSASTAPPPTGYLYQGRKYKLVIRRSYQESFQRAAAKAGLAPEFNPYSLRYLYASTALTEGIPITEVSRWLGHKSIEVPHQIYGHLIPSSFDRASTALDAAFQKSHRREPQNVELMWHTRRPGITQIYKGTSQIQRMVIAPGPLT